MSNYNPKTKIFGVSGSPRINGNSDAILKAILSGANEVNVPFESVNLSKVQFQGCIACEKCRVDKICTGLIDGMSALYDKVTSSKGIILVSPTHNYNITAWLKAFIDRLYCFYNFTNSRPRNWSSQFDGQNRKAVVAAICEQESIKDMGFTMEAMVEPLKALGYEIIGELRVLNVFDKQKVKDNKEVIGKAFELGKKLANSIKNN